MTKVKNKEAPIWVAAVSSLALFACNDPIVGDWRAAERACDGERSRFTINGDLDIRGTIWLSSDTECLECDFDGTVEESGDQRYRSDIEFETCNCGGERSADGECRINDDGDQLDCEIDFGECGTLEAEFEKQED